MTTLAYCAVSPDGQGAPDEIVVARRGGARPARSSPTPCTPRARRSSAQLGHAGPVAAGTGRTRPRRRRGVFSPLAHAVHARAATDGRHRARHRATSPTRRGVVADAGFDAVEIHLGHGYLLERVPQPRSSTSAPTAGAARSRTAPRSPARSPRRCATRSAPTSRCSAKLNMADGVPRRPLARRERRGGAAARGRRRARRASSSPAAARSRTRCTCSGARRRSHEMAAAFPQPMRPAFQPVRQALPPRVPVRGGLLPAATPASSAPRCRCRSSCSAASTASRPIAAGASPRASSSSRWAGRCCASPTSSAAGSGRRAEALCIHCNKCMPTIYRGTHCVLVAPEARPGHR